MAKKNKVISFCFIERSKQKPSCEKQTSQLKKRTYSAVKVSNGFALF